MFEENISTEFGMKNVDETTNDVIEEINQNELMSKKNKKVYGVLNYMEHLFILISTVTGCISISGFASLVGIPIGIMSVEIGLKICVIIARIKEYKLIINKKKKRHGQVLSLAKSKLNSIEVLISRALIDSNISHNEFVLINNVLNEFHVMKEEIRNYNDK